MGKKKKNKPEPAAQSAADDLFIHGIIRPRTELYVSLTLFWFFGALLLLRPLLRCLILKQYCFAVLLAIFILVAPALLVYTIISARREQPVSVTTNLLTFKTYLYATLIWMPFVLLGLPMLLSKVITSPALVWSICLPLILIEPVWLIYSMLKKPSSMDLRLPSELRK